MVGFVLIPPLFIYLCSICIIILLYTSVSFVFSYLYLFSYLCCFVMSRSGFDGHGFCGVWGKNFESQWLYVNVTMFGNK